MEGSHVVKVVQFQITRSCYQKLLNLDVVVDQDTVPIAMLFGQSFGHSQSHEDFVNFRQIVVRQYLGWILHIEFFLLDEAFFGSDLGIHFVSWFDQNGRSAMTVDVNGPMRRRRPIHAQCFQLDRVVCVPVEVVSPGKADGLKNKVIVLSSRGDHIPKQKGQSEVTLTQKRHVSGMSDHTDGSFQENLFVKCIAGRVGLVRPLGSITIVARWERLFLIILIVWVPTIGRIVEPHQSLTELVVVPLGVVPGDGSAALKGFLCGKGGNVERGIIRLEQGIVSELSRSWGCHVTMTVHLALASGGVALAGEKRTNERFKHLSWINGRRDCRRVGLRKHFQMQPEQRADNEYVWDEKNQRETDFSP